MTTVPARRIPVPPGTSHEETSLQEILTRIDTLDSNWTSKFNTLNRKVGEVKRIQSSHATQLATLHPLTAEQAEELADLTGRRVAKAALLGVLKSWKGLVVSGLGFVGLVIAIVGGIITIVHYG